MGLGDIFKTVLGIGAAPVTGGASLIPLGLGVAGDILSNTKGARTTTSTPTITPEYKTLADLLRGRAEQRLRSSTDLGGYAASGISGINDVYGNVGQTLNNSLTARGLATSPVAATVDTNLQTARAGSIAQLLNSLPLLQRQLQNEDMSAALGLIDNLGRGTTSVGPGSALGAGIGGAGQALGHLQDRNILRQIYGI